MTDLSDSSDSSGSSGSSGSFEEEYQEEDNLHILCNRVFTNPPADPCTWSLYLDENIASEVPQTEWAMYIFEILVQVLFGGISILFGTNEDGKISLGSLTQENFELLRRYFQMMEYDIHMDVYTPDEQPLYEKFDPTDFTTVHLKFLKEYPDEVDEEGNVMKRFIDIHFVPFAKPEQPIHLEANMNPNHYRPNPDLL